MKHIRPLALFAGLILLLPACTPEGVAVSTAASAGTAARQERGFAQAIADTGTRAEVIGYWLEADERLLTQARVVVHEGRALLTGAVDDAALRERAEKEASRASGVSRIINELQVDPDYDLGDAAVDEKITVTLRSRMLFDGSISSSNYALDTVDGVVYLFGIAQDRGEIERVEAHASEIARVRRIVNHLVLKRDPGRPPDRR
ncbi:MAG: BON domain-containing protein [Pirellulales bacterium]|nr:BON domain-containing protein [Pirellulales bacterium]